MPAERLGEFGRIAACFRPLAVANPGSLGLMDDAALIEPPTGQTLVATMDTMVEGVHFLPTDPPALVARKLLRVNLSDLAAMAAQPLTYLLSIALPERCDDSWVESFAQGLALDQEAFGITLSGGDSVSTPGPVTLTITALGYAPGGRIRRRSGAKPGDTVWLSGTAGDGALGLLAATGQLSGLTALLLDALADRYRLPQPRLALGRALGGVATAMMDVSDGLAADLGHLCAASCVGAVLDSAAIPVSEAAAAAIAGDLDLFQRILGGGDDYELLFTAPASAEQDICAAGVRTETNVTRIGQIHSGAGVRVLDREGQVIDVARPGWVHS